MQKGLPQNRQNENKRELTKSIKVKSSVEK
jgi:hypothetical protein